MRGPVWTPFPLLLNALVTILKRGGSYLSMSICLCALPCHGTIWAMRTNAFLRYNDETASDAVAFSARHDYLPKFRSKGTPITLQITVQVHER